MAGGGSHLLSPRLSGGDVHHQDPLCLKHGLMLWPRMWLNRGSGLLAYELASPWRCRWGGCFPAMARTIRDETVIVAYVAGAFSIHSVVVARANDGLVSHLLAEGKPKLPAPLDALRNSSVESSTLAYHGVDALLRVEPMKVAPLVIHPGGEAQAAEVVNDELKVSEVNGFAEGESAARQALAIGGDGECR
jgi:hypothetical protein